MAKNEDLIKRIDQLERQFSLLESITKFRAGRDTKDLRELERIVDGLKRQLNGVSKQANKTEESLSSLTREVIRIDGSNDMRREDIVELKKVIDTFDERIRHLAETASGADTDLEDRIRGGVSWLHDRVDALTATMYEEFKKDRGALHDQDEEVRALREEQSAQASTQLDFGKRLAALEQVWWNAPIGDWNHRRIEQLVESAALDNERRLREELRGALDKRIAGLRSEWQYFKNLVGNDLYSLKEVQVKHGNRLDNCVAQDEDFHTRLEAVLKRIEALEKAPTKVIIPDCSVEPGVLRDRVRNLERKEFLGDVTSRVTEYADGERFTGKTPSWRAVVDSQKNVADDLKHQKLKSTLFLHLSRVYGEDSTITALARTIALVEKNMGLVAWPGHSSVFRASPLDLGIAIVNDQWQAIADIAARMLSEELAK